MKFILLKFIQSTPISSSLALGAKGVHQCVKVLKERNSSTAMWFFKRNAVAVGKFRPHLNSNSFSRQSRISFEVYLQEHIWSWSTSTHIHQKGMRVGGMHKTIPRKGRRKRENKNSGINKQLLFLALLYPLLQPNATLQDALFNLRHKQRIKKRKTMHFYSPITTTYKHTVNPFTA